MDVTTHDVLLVGGGGAGLRAAIAVSEFNPNLKVAVVSKVYPMRSHTVSAEGGAAGVIKADDSLDEHAYDTISGGDWLCDQDAVEAFVKEAPQELLQLEHWGCPWSRQEDGHIAVRPFGGMKKMRTWFAADKTGFHMLHTLFQTTMKYNAIFRYDEWFVTKLLVDDGRVQGVVAIELMSGKIQAITQVDVKSKASGIVKKLYVDYGQMVTRGQVLAELDKEEIQARVNQQRASLEAAEAAANGTVADLQRAKIDAEGPDVPMLKRAYDRAVQMAKEGVVSQASLDDAHRNYEMAVNKQKLAQANEGVAQAKVRESQAQVSQSRALLAQTDEEFRNSTITAPIDGMVLSRNVEVGDAVSSILVLGSSATLVMTIGDIREVYVKGKVDESDIAKVYLGQEARIKVESYKDRTFGGKITKISPMGVEKDNVTTFEVRVSIDNSKGELKPMMTANAEILLEEHKNVLMVPEGALIYDRERKASIEVPDPGSRCSGTIAALTYRDGRVRQR